MYHEDDHDIQEAIRLSLEQSQHQSQQHNRYGAHDDELELAIQLSLQESNKKAKVDNTVPSMHVPLPAPLSRQVSDMEAYAAAIEASLRDQTSIPHDDLGGKIEEILIPHKMKKVFYAARSILEFKYGVKLIIIGKEGKLRISGPNEMATTIAKRAIEEILENPFILDQEIQQLQEQNIHIFIDQSNIFISSQYVPNPNNNNVIERDIRIRMKCDELHNLVACGRNVREKVVFGSRTATSVNNHAENGIWEKWESLQYRVAWATRVNGEEFVDNALISEIQRSLLTYPSPPHPSHTLVLLTGDGNDNNGQASFYGVVQSALLQGWKVELWAWRCSCSKNYLNYLNSYSGTGQFKIIYLDDYRENISYVWAGHGSGGAGAVTGGHHLKDGGGFPRGNAFNPRGQPAPRYPSNSRGQKDDARPRYPPRSLQNDYKYAPRNFSPATPRADSSYSHQPPPAEAPSSLPGQTSPPRLRTKNEKGRTVIDLLESSSSSEDEDEDNDWMNCPITLSPLEQPIQTKYGHIYERRAIVQWIQRKGSCPMTSQPLTEADLRPVSEDFLSRLKEYKRTLAGHGKNEHSTPNYSRPRPNQPRPHQSTYHHQQVDARPRYPHPIPHLAKQQHVPHGYPSDQHHHQPYHPRPQHPRFNHPPNNFPPRNNPPQQRNSNSNYHHPYSTPPSQPPPHPFYSNKN
jgi:hypothetical protein